MDAAMVWVRQQIRGQTDLDDRVLTEAPETEALPYAIITRTGQEDQTDFDGDTMTAEYISIDLRAQSVAAVDTLHRQVLAALRRGSSNRLLSGMRVSEDETDDPARPDADKVVSRLLSMRVLSY